MMKRYNKIIIIYVLIFFGISDSLYSQITNKSLIIDSSKITNSSRGSNPSVIFINNGMFDLMNK